MKPDKLGITYEQEESFEDVDRGDFQIGQCYTEGFAKTVICPICKGDQFIVGRDDHFTAIKCPKCKYQLAIHQG